MRAGTGVQRAIALALVAAIFVAAPGCLFRKKKARAPAYPATPVRLALLPLNVPEGNADLQWLALGTVAVMARQAEKAQDLELVPVWQSWPVAIESLGTSRSVTDEITALTATRLSAKWATRGEIEPSKNGLRLLIDFIPAKATLVSFRYSNDIRVDELDANVREAFDQFLRYLIARPLPKPERGGSAVDQTQLREIAGALDREHGWFTTAEPGKAEKQFAGVARSDSKLAGFLFNPALYQPAAARPASAPGTVQAAPPPESAPAPPPAPEPTPAPTAAAAPRTPDVAPPPPETPKAASTVAPSPEPAAPSLPKAQSTVRIQVFSSRDPKEADQLAEKLRRAGIEPEVEKVDLKEKGVWYRIRLGFASRQAAEEMGKKLQADGVIREFWIVP